ncbi:MAG: hypothetical protein M1825_001054 [Sarcosagium campestre]|nr:MAG: hypothetical protein M1825_001054 [Sarcosagium campestre]
MPQAEMSRCGPTTGMDLNPYRFIEPWDAYEFSNHVLANSSSLVIMTMAWLTSPPSSDPAPPPPSQSEAVRPHVETVNYWLDRLKPLIDARHERTIVVALCNRCGVEGTATYAGSSTILTICQGRIAILGVAGKADERLLVIDTAD